MANKQFNTQKKVKAYRQKQEELKAKERKAKLDAVSSKSSVPYGKKPEDIPKGMSVREWLRRGMKVA
jgi:hypothetical protein